MPHRKFTPQELETFRRIDRFNEVGRAMKHGTAPPVDLVLEELDVFDLYFISPLREMLAAIQRGDVEKVAETLGVLEPMLWHIADVRCRAPNVPSYIFERWPAIGQRFDAMLDAFHPFVVRYGIDRKKTPLPALGPQAIGGLVKSIDDLEYAVEAARSTLESYGLSTADGPSTPPQEAADGPSPFVAANILERLIGTYKKFKAFLRRHPEIPTLKPSSNRLLVHAGAFHRALQAESDAAFAAGDIEPIAQEIDRDRHLNHRNAAGQ